MNFLFQERRAFVRTRSHTVVRDRDPDFRYFCSTQDGEIEHVVRIWLGDQRNVPTAYLGCLRVCRSVNTSLRELRAIVRRLEEYAPDDREALREELLRRVRQFVSKLKNETPD